MTHDFYHWQAQLGWAPALILLGWIVFGTHTLIHNVQRSKQS